MVKSKSFGARVFVVVNALVIGLLAASCLIPLIHVFAISLSDKSSASGGLVALWPVKFTLESYKYVINRAPFWTAMLVSLKRVLVGVSLNKAVIVGAIGATRTLHDGMKVSMDCRQGSVQSLAE